jgi:hypothetical protein
VVLWTIDQEDTNMSNPRLDNLVANYAMPRPTDDDATALYWMALVNAWFLCGVIRMNKGAADEFSIDVLNQSSSIVWC